MAKLFNRAKMTTSTTGTGTITLGSASNGFQSFADAGVANGDVVQYVIEEGSNFEIGTGTYTATGTTLSRTPTESSNSDNAISLAGNATVSITAVAADMNRLQHNGSDKVTVSSTGASVTGNLAVTGTVDGRDVAADGTKLDGIEASADVTDTANVTAAGALMDSEVTNLAQVKAFDSSDYATAAQGTTADAALARSGGTMTGAITFASGQTFDGRDVSADGSKLDGIESGAEVNDPAFKNIAVSGQSTVVADADADTLNLAAGSNVTITTNASTDTVTIASTDTNTVPNNATITISAGDALTGGGNFTTDQASNETITINHQDTSSQASVNNSGRTYIQDITLDTYGHVTGISSATETVTNTNTNQLTTFQVEDGDGTEVTISHGKEWKFVEGGGIDINWTDTSTGSDGDPYDLTIKHNDTSSQASVNNSNGTVIQDVTLDTYGHVTGLTSYNLDGRYYTETEADSRFVNVTGDTMTAPLTIDTNTSGMLRLSATNSSPWAIDLQRDDATNSRVFNGGGYWQFEHTPRVSSSTIWHAGNDGSGSGLDADTLDGVQGSSFLRSDADDTATGIITIQNASDYQLKLDGGSSTWAGIYFEDVNGTDPIWYFGSSGTFAIGGGGSSVSGKKLHVDGGLSVGVNADATSTPSNGIYSEGQISVGGNTVWHAGNDGSGSGLDADTVDGVHESSFMRKSANSGLDMNQNDITDGNTIYMDNWYRSTGSSGWYNQTYAGGINMEDSTWVRVYGSKAFYVANQIAAAGNITAYYSDERLKTKTGDIEGALEKIKQLNGFYYVENDLAKEKGYNTDNQQVALSAQDVQAVMPEAVSLAPFDMKTLEDGTIVSQSGEDYLTVDYARLVPLLVEAIKEQQQQIDELKAKLEG